MDHYDPIHRIQDEIDLPTAARLVELCLHYFTATTASELDAVIARTEALMLERLEPNDPLQLLLGSILDRAQQQARLIQSVADWTTTHAPSARVIEVLPERWQAELQTESVSWLVYIQQAWDMEQDQYQAIISER